MTFQQLEGVWFRGEDHDHSRIGETIGNLGRNDSVLRIDWLDAEAYAIGQQLSSIHIRRCRATALDCRRAGLGIPLDDIADILQARDNNVAPCQRVLEALDQRLAEIDQRIADLLAMRETLDQLKREGAALPLDDVRGEQCVCYLLKTYRESGRVMVQREEMSND